MLKKLSKKFDPFANCRELGIEVWSCPRFIFLLMGSVIIASILTTYVIAQHFIEPEMVIVLVSALTIFLLIVTQIIVGAFEKIVLMRVHDSRQTKEVMELRDQFVHFAVHDLASAATAVKWGLRIIEPKISEFSAVEKEVFSSIRQRNELLIELVRHIRLITRIESGTTEYHPETLHLSALVEKVLADLDRAAKAKNITVVYEPPQTPTDIISDSEYLSEILRILTINALNHSAEKNGAICITLSTGDKGARISFANNGPQLSAELCPHIFDKLWRKDTSAKKEILGTSFGLFIVKSLATTLKGDISFTTTPDQTVFTLTLPKEIK